MRPRPDAIAQTLMERRDFAGRNVAFEHEMQAAEMNSHGLVGVLPARVLDCVAIHGQFMDLLEQRSVAVFSRQHLREEIPTLRRRIDVAVTRRALLDRQS